MNLKSKNGEDVLTLDAAERRCLTNAKGILESIELHTRQVSDLRENAGCAKHLIIDVLEAIPEPQPRKKAATA